MTAAQETSTRTHQPRALRRFSLLLGLLMVMGATVCLPGSALAQERESSSVSPIGLLKKAALDPTTYAAAILSYDSTMRDWNTSQPFFANGFHEWNERFTLSGLPNDLPVSYHAGRQLILKDALVTLQISAANNLATHAVESLLLKRFPNHRRLVKTLGLIDRVASASYMSYRLSAGHYRQARYNTTLARSLGYR